MQHQEKYTLDWHSYSDHLKEALKEMMLSSEFADVTLVTDDKQQIRAHRNILSAASPVFKSILQIDSKNDNPVIYLRGIQHSEIESIMQFIYLGEARFYQERMSEFLTVSKNLEIKELSTGIEINDQEESNKNNDDDENIDTAGAPPHKDSGNVEIQAQTEPITPNNATNRRVRRTEVASGDAKFHCQDCERIFSSQSGLWHHTKSKHEGVKYACNHCDKQYTDKSDLRNHIKSIHDGVKYACYQCDYQASRQDNLTTHIKSIHEGVKYACNQCDQQFTLQRSLIRHIQTVHEGLKYACNQCDYQATQQSHLTTHIQSVHEGVKYACNQCDKQYTQKVDLNKHIKSIHKGVNYACYQCEYEAPRQDKLTIHLKRKHL